MTREQLDYTINKFGAHGNTVDNVILFIPEREHLVVFEEPTGSQLTDEDYREGIDSYIMATVINTNPYTGTVGELADGDSEQCPLFYDSTQHDNEFELLYDWLESFYGNVPWVQIVRV